MPGPARRDTSISSDVRRPRAGGGDALGALIAEAMPEDDTGGGSRCATISENMSDVEKL
jgi:hypothetical protein